MEMPAQTRKGAQRVACALLLVAFVYVSREHVADLTGYAMGGGGGFRGHERAQRHWAATGRQERYDMGPVPPQGRYDPRQGPYGESMRARQRFDPRERFGPRPSAWNERYAGRPMFDGPPQGPGPEAFVPPGRRSYWQGAGGNRSPYARPEMDAPPPDQGPGAQQGEGARQGGAAPEQGEGRPNAQPWVSRPYWSQPRNDLFGGPQGVSTAEQPEAPPQEAPPQAQAAPGEPWKNQIEEQMAALAEQQKRMEEMTAASLSRIESNLDVTREGTPPHIDPSDPSVPSFADYLAQKAAGAAPAAVSEEEAKKAWLAKQR